MDSDHSVEKPSKSKRRYLPDLKLDNLGYNSGTREGQSADFGSYLSRLDTKKPSPEIEGNPKHWTVVSEGFPPGVTVDELKKYGRRRQLSHLRPQDNLRLEEGSLKAYKSEYKRRYKAYNILNLSERQSELKKQLENKDDTIFLPEYRKSYVEYPQVYFERPNLRRPMNNLLPLKDHPMEITTEKNSQYIAFPNHERRKLLRKSTALKPEGEMTSETEVRREYKLYEKPERAQIIRRLPSLKLEGEFEKMTTEKREKFMAFLLGQRPILEKKKTSLKMEGDFDFLTEKKLKYVPHELTERPRVRKRSTSLKLDGEVEFFPEYRNSYVDFPRTRPITYKPNENIHHHEGEFHADTETKAKFINYENVSVPSSAKPENNLHIEGKMEITPEYRINFVDFPRERPFLRKPPNQLKPEGNLQVLTETSERYLNVASGEKPVSLRRPSNLKLEGDIDFLSENSEKYKKPEIIDKTELSLEKPIVPKIIENGKSEEETEKSDKFGLLVPEREITGKRPSSLKLDGEFLFLPEFHKYNVDFGRPKNVLKPIQGSKSNPSSPRKKPKEKIKLHLDNDTKSILGTPHKRLNAKKLKEALTEKNLKFDIPNDILLKSNNIYEEKNKENEFNTNFHFKESVGIEKPLMPSKEFPAFQVLDVKGQLGCQTMKKDLLESEKSTSDEENTTYRLEVSNSGIRSPGFYKSEQRVFPQTAIDPEELEEAEKRAKQRAENFVKVVKSPQVPYYLTEENYNGKENWWNVPEKLCPLTPPKEIKKRAFVVLDNRRSLSPKPVTRENSSPLWMASLPASTKIVRPHTQI